jgi:sec-independent protein translocase protein TatB
MYLFILESIGTSELIIIGLVALIFLGPRKLPELARSIGKAMNEFRRSTNEFKQTWEREVGSEVNKFKDDLETSIETENLPKQIESDERNIITNKNIIAAPEIREVSGADFQKIIPKENLEPEKKTEEITVSSSKQSWL